MARGVTSSESSGETGPALGRKQVAWDETRIGATDAPAEASRRLPRGAPAHRTYPRTVTRG